MQRSGISRVSKKARSAAELLMDTLWSLTVHHMFGGKCGFCGARGTSAHHIIKRRFKRYRWLATNGVWLCRTCHDESERSHAWCLQKLKELYPVLFELYQGRNPHEPHKMTDEKREQLKAALAERRAERYRGIFKCSGSVEVAFLLGCSLLLLTVWFSIAKYCGSMLGFC